MSPERTNFLMKKAMEIRITGLKMVQKAHSGHIGGAFSLSEIMAVLYFEKMRIDPQRPLWEDRDRLVLSKGHATVALYPTLALRGYFPAKELNMFRRLEGHLSGHAEMNHVPGVDMSTGSLEHRQGGQVGDVGRAWNGFGWQTGGERVLQLCGSRGRRDRRRADMGSLYGGK